MLYRTHHHPFLSSFNPFSHNSLSPHFPPSSSSSPRLQGMEPEMALKTAVLDELVVPGDDFFVDELLDFSNGFEEEEQQQQPELLQEKEQEKNTSSSVENLTAPENSGVSLTDDFASLPESELSLPVSAEGLESLEWLSNFVEDSFPDYSLTGKLPEKRPEPKAFFTTPVQTKARTKRARTGARIWPVLSPSFTESSTSSSSSSSSPTSFWTVQSQTGDSFTQKPPTKKPKKKNSDTTAAAAGGGGIRRCSHCGVTKTPQWRAGPLGSKTLCNACGVRYKSGRLLPEYRPACSPTFSSEVHSNNHRKVLEMRRKKEMETEGGGGGEPASAHSF